MGTLSLRWGRLSLTIRYSSAGVSRIKIEGMHSTAVKSKHNLTRLIDCSIFDSFSVPWEWFQTSNLTDFTRDVLKAVSSVPSGQVRSYGWVASSIDRNGACQAVGQALSSNPLPLLIPCHRIVRADGSSGGFQSENDSKIKKYLLDLE